MGRLIKGAGFGNMMEGNRTEGNADSVAEAGETTRPLIEPTCESTPTQALSDDDLQKPTSP